MRTKQSRYRKFDSRWTRTSFGESAYGFSYLRYLPNSPSAAFAGVRIAPILGRSSIQFGDRMESRTPRFAPDEDRERP